MKIQDILAIAKPKRQTFPELIAAYKKEGVISYTYSIEEGQYIFFGRDNSTFSALLDGTPSPVSSTVIEENLRIALQKVQGQEIDFHQFCVFAGLAGVSHWVVDLEGMTVKYQNTDGNDILVEKIPSL